MEEQSVAQKLNTLSYRVGTNANQLAFELLIDGVSICEMIEDPGTLLIYWYLLEDHSVNDDLPLEKRWNNVDARLLTVCTCGHAGCGALTCEIVFEGVTVIWRDFYGGGEDDWEFKFSLENYRSVASEMINLAREHLEQKKS